MYAISFKGLYCFKLQFAILSLQTLFFQTLTLKFFLFTNFIFNIDEFLTYFSFLNTPFVGTSTYNPNKINPV